MRNNHRVAPKLAETKHRSFARERLDQDVKDIHATINRLHMDAYRDFEANKTQYVEAARKHHAEHPELEVYERYKQIDADILAQREHLLQQAYEKHGFNYEMESYALKQKFNVSR